MSIKRILILIILLASVVRFWKLESLPYPPNGDELAFAYYGWSLLHYLTDEFGNTLPIYFPSVGDFKYPTFAYLNIIPAVIFGLSDIMPRILSATLGTLLVPIIFLISKLIFKSNIASLSSAFFIAAAPWAITLSRLGYETNIAIFLTSLAILLILAISSPSNNQHFIKKIKKQKKKIWGAIFLLLLASSYCYGSQRVFIPIMMFSLFILTYVKKSQFKSIRIALFTLFISLTIINVISLIPWQSRGRASGVLVTNLSQEDQENLDQSIRDAGLSSIKVPTLVTRMFNNKIETQAINYLGRYTTHFSSDYLFLKGDVSLETTPGIGVIMLIEVFFLPIALLTLFTNSKQIELKLVLLAWVLVGPFASALTVNGPHITRGAIGLVPFAILSGYGLEKALSIRKLTNKRFTVGLIFILLATNFFFVINQIFIQKPSHRPWWSDQATKEMATEVLKLRNQYNAIAIPDNQYIFFLYYGNISPKEFLAISEIGKPTEENHWEPVAKLGNIYFKMPYDCPKGGKLNVLYVCKGLNIPQNSRVVKTIRFQDTIPAYSLIEFYPLSQMSPTLPELPQRLQYMVDTEYLYPDGIIPKENPLPW